MPRCYPGRGERSIVNESDIFEAIEDPVDDVDVEPPLSETLGQLGPRPCRQREPAQDDCPSLALGVSLRTQAAGLII